MHKSTVDGILKAKLIKLKTFFIASIELSAVCERSLLMRVSDAGGGGGGVGYTVRILIFVCEQWNAVSRCPVN